MAVVRVADQLTEDHGNGGTTAEQAVPIVSTVGGYKKGLLRTVDGALTARTDEGRLTVLMADLWATGFPEAHESIWVGHLRTPQTLARLKPNFWLLQMRAAVVSRLSSCQ